jgi:hypothetical protein
MSPRGNAHIDQSARRQPVDASRQYSLAHDPVTRREQLQAQYPNLLATDIDLLLQPQQHAGRNPETPQQTTDTLGAQSPRSSVYWDAEDSDSPSIPNDNEITSAGSPGHNDAGMPTPMRAVTPPNVDPIHLPVDEQPAHVPNPALEVLRECIRATIAQLRQMDLPPQTYEACIGRIYSLEHLAHVPSPLVESIHDYIVSAREHLRQVDFPPQTQEACIELIHRLENIAHEAANQNVTSEPYQRNSQEMADILERLGELFGNEPFIDSPFNGGTADGDGWSARAGAQNNFGPFQNEGLVEGIPVGPTPLFTTMGIATNAYVPTALLSPPLLAYMSHLVIQANSGLPVHIDQLLDTSEFITLEIASMRHPITREAPVEHGPMPTNAPGFTAQPAHRDTVPAQPFFMQDPGVFGMAYVQAQPGMPPPYPGNPGHSSR